MSAYRAPHANKFSSEKIRNVVFIGCCVILGALSAGPAWTACDDEQARFDVTTELQSIFRTQRPDGSLDFRGPLSFLERHPMLATLALDMQRHEKDPAFLSRSTSAISRYYGYLFDRKDRNANLLIETTVPSPGGPDLVNVEDSGYNALLSLDMIALARLQLDVRKPHEALYWYEGARLLQQQLIESCFDIDANYFFPFDPVSGTRIRDYYALSVIPALFQGNLGDNHISGMISNYLLKSGQHFPETPSSYLYRSKPSSGGPPSLSSDPASLLKTVLLVKVLDARGYRQDAEKAARAALDKIGLDRARGSAGGRQHIACADYLACLLENGGYRRLYDPFVPAEIFGELVKQKRRIKDNEIVRLAKNLETVGTLIHQIDLPGTAPQTQIPDTFDESIRNVYQAVSKTREQVSAKRFFAREDAYDMSGLELDTATNHLLDDVVLQMRSAENELFRRAHSNTGLYVSATVLNERATLGQNIEIKWTFGTKFKQAKIQSVEIIHSRSVDQLIKPGEGVVIEPKKSLTLSYHFPAHFDRINTVEPVRLTLVLQDGQGRKMKYNVLRSVYLEQPVKIVAEFPQGKILRDLSVPIDVRIVKKSGAHVDLQAGWYSPAGLRLKEGNSLQYVMTAAQDSAAVRVHVLVPNPCRPGSFPFKFKFFGNGQDLGTISSTLFKPYQWLFIGPFESSHAPLATIYPPEKAVELQQTYPGIGRRVAWQILPGNAHSNSGAVLLRGALTQPGVGYLYTVIESSSRKQCPVYLGANTPAAVFINGERVLTYQPSETPRLADAQVQVKQGLNNILVKVLGDRTSSVFFKLGDDDELPSDEFNNNLWELVGGFSDFHKRSQERLADDDAVQKLVTLRYDDPGANSVSVIGTFNGWSPEHSRMRRSPEGTWEITLSLSPGKYAYRFLINNRKQVLDPQGSYEEPDGYGGKNSVIFVMK